MFKLQIIMTLHIGSLITDSECQCIDHARKDSYITAALQYLCMHHMAGSAMQYYLRPFWYMGRQT